MDFLRQGLNNGSSLPRALNLNKEHFLLLDGLLRNKISFLFVYMDNNRISSLTISSFFKNIFSECLEGRRCHFGVSLGHLLLEELNENGDTLFYGSNNENKCCVINFTAVQLVRDGKEA